MAKREEIRVWRAWRGSGGGGALAGSGLMTTTRWPVMISSEESRREASSSASSAKNSIVLVLKARASFWNMPEIWGGFREASVSSIAISPEDSSSKASCLN